MVAVMPDLMVDIETTGTDPYHNAMVQLAAIEFNYRTGDIGRTFNMSLEIPKGRYWDEDCRNNFWRPKWALFQQIMSTARPSAEVMPAFYDWVRQSPVVQRLWTRGIFDWFFIQSYLDRHDLPMPFKFWETRELRSFTAGRFGKPEEPDLKWVGNSTPGDAHNALYDCVVQLKQLFSARDGIFHEILPPEGEAA